jgi:hypothetical protein
MIKCRCGSVTMKLIIQLMYANKNKVLTAERQNKKSTAMHCIFQTEERILTFSTKKG